MIYKTLGQYYSIDYSHAVKFFTEWPKKTSRKTFESVGTQIHNLMSSDVSNMT